MPSIDAILSNPYAVFVGAGLIFMVMCVLACIPDIIRFIREDV